MVIGLRVLDLAPLGPSRSLGAAGADERDAVLLA